MLGFMLQCYTRAKTIHSKKKQLLNWGRVIWWKTYSYYCSNVYIVSQITLFTAVRLAFLCSFLCTARMQAGNINATQTNMENSERDTEWGHSERENDETKPGACKRGASVAWMWFGYEKSQTRKLFTLQTIPHNKLKLTSFTTHERITSNSTARVCLLHALIENMNKGSKEHLLLGKYSKFWCGHFI